MEKEKKFKPFMADGEIITDEFKMTLEDGTKVTAKASEQSYDNTSGASQVPIRLKELRKRHGLTQGDLAQVLGCSTREYWRYEQQGYNTNYNKLFALASFYNVSLDYIFGLVDVRIPIHKYSEVEKTPVEVFKKQKAETEQ